MLNHWLREDRSMLVHIEMYPRLKEEAALVNSKHSRCEDIPQPCAAYSLCMGANSLWCQLTDLGPLLLKMQCEYLKVTAFCLDIAPSGDWLWYHLPVPALLLQKPHKGRFARR